MDSRPSATGSAPPFGEAGAAAASGKGAPAAASLAAPLGQGGEAGKRAPLHILIVDDDYTNRLILKAILAKEGYRVTMAENGAEAAALFEADPSDMVLMDILMPVMDGYEATRRIKEMAADRFVPVIFLTAVNDEKSLAKCVQCGGDDFLTKPYNRVILKAKIDALERVRQLYSTLQQQKDQLDRHHQRLQREHEIAEVVFANIVEPGCLDAANIKYILSPMAITNGDLVMAARKPSGGQHILLGDLTGHGLSAAIGAMPVSDIFYSMTEKGYSILDIASELNQKLKDRLPIGLFLAACLIELDASQSTLIAWNGGLPDVLLYGADGTLKHRLPSKHLPLGVVNSEHLENHTEIIEVVRGDRAYIYSDGVIEATDPEGEMFGQERLEAIPAKAGPPEQWFDRIGQTLDAFRNGAPQSDDITLIEVTCDPELMEGPEPTHHHAPTRAPMSWSLEAEFGADTLRHVDPLPQLVQMLSELQGLEEHRARIYTVMAELFSNALEHGVLGLDSALKKNIHGFAEYYTRRQAALEGLDDGWVRVLFDHRPTATGGRLTIAIEDSGRGFDVATTLPKLEENLASSGRGIALVRTLCDAVGYNERGNRVEVVYSW